MKSSDTIIIRNATAADAGTLERLTMLDSRGPLTGPAMIAEVGGVARVALDLHDGSVAADPFAHTAQLIELLKSPLLSADRTATAQPRRSKKKMRSLVAALFSAGALSLAAAPEALTAPAEQSPVGGPGAHPHHVHTGNGGCHDIDSVRFEPDHRGLHRGANQSGTAHGPWHGTCAGHIHRAP